MVVTTALCAEQVAAASVAPRAEVARRDAMPPVVQFAGRLVSRLSQSFCRVVPKSIPAESAQPQRTAPETAVPVDDQSTDVVQRPFSPFEFRLPPPTA